MSRLKLLYKVMEDRTRVLQNTGMTCGWSEGDKLGHSCFPRNIFRYSVEVVKNLTLKVRGRALVVLGGH